MQDPSPENIRGSKVQHHSFEHRINWGHLVIGLAAIYIAAQLLGGRNDEDGGEHTRR